MDATHRLVPTGPWAGVWSYVLLPPMAGQSAVHQTFAWSKTQRTCRGAIVCPVDPPVRTEARPAIVLRTLTVVNTIAAMGSTTWASVLHLSSSPRIRPDFPEAHRGVENPVQSQRANAPRRRRSGGVDPSPSCKTHGPAAPRETVRAISGRRRRTSKSEEDARHRMRLRSPESSLLGFGGAPTQVRRIARARSSSSG